MSILPSVEPQTLHKNIPYCYSVRDLEKVLESVRQGIVGQVYLALDIEHLPEDQIVAEAVAARQTINALQMLADPIVVGPIPFSRNTLIESLTSESIRPTDRTYEQYIMEAADYQKYVKQTIDEVGSFSM